MILFVRPACRGRRARSPVTGNLEYDRFDYDPETGTEAVVTPDTTPSRPGDPERVP